MTNDQTIKILARQIINFVEHGGGIEYQSDHRGQINDHLYELLRQSLVTEERIKDDAWAAVDKQEEVGSEAGFSRDQMYTAAKKSLVSQFGGEHIGGLYLKNTPKQISESVGSFFMNEDLIEDVFWDDDELNSKILKVIVDFDPGNIS